MPIDPRRYLLTDEESRRIFADDIVPDQLAHGVPQASPTVVFIAGQPGAGKTKTTEMVQRQLDRRGGAVIVNSDFYKPFHPQYARLLAEDDRNAAPYTSMDGRRWMAAAEQHLIDHRVDTIIETTMRDPGDFVEPARMFRDAGYRVEAVVMAVPEPLSRLGIVDRYQTQVDQLGHGRLTARENHDASYAGVLDAARTIDADRLVDQVSVYRRGNVLLYQNTLNADGDWQEPPGTAAAIAAERDRPWSADETRRFAGTVTRLADRTGSDWHDELTDIVRRAEPNAGPDVPLPLTPQPQADPAQRDADLPESQRDADPPEPQPEADAPEPSRGADPPQRSDEVGAATLAEIRAAAAAIRQAREALDDPAPPGPAAARTDPEPPPPQPERPANDIDR